MDVFDAVAMFSLIIGLSLFVLEMLEAEEMEDKL